MTPGAAVQVALGANSVTATANPTGSATVGGITYSGFAGAAFGILPRGDVSRFHDESPKDV